MNQDKQPPWETRGSAQDIEQGSVLTPKFDQNGLIPAIATDAASGEVLMHAYMNAEALQKTLETGQAHYWSRSRNELWRKGATSGQTQTIIEMRIDCDQDTIWLRVEVAGNGVSCHTGARSCFYRSVSLQPETGPARLRLEEPK